MDLFNKFKTHILFLKQMFRWVAKPRSYKMYVFYDDDSEVFFHEIMAEYTLAKIKEHIDTCHRVLIDVKYRIEVRYSINDKKYRVVIRDNDVKLPIRKELGVKKHDLTSALLILRDDHISMNQHGSGSGCGHDVTDRIRKYLGQNKDFNACNGSVVFVQDCFPFDDQYDNSQRFSVLRLHFTNGKYYDFDYEQNDKLSSPTL